MQLDPRQINPPIKAMTENGKIYKIVSFQTEKCYFGSTLRNISVNTRESYKCYQKGNTHYVTSFESLLENYPSNNKQELYEKDFGLSN